MDNKNSNGMRKVGKGIWETLNSFLLTQELRCMLFWGLFPGVFSDICPGQDNPLCWRSDRSYCNNPYGKLYMTTSCPVKCGLCPGTSTWGSLLCPASSSWGIFTLTSYFHFRSLYSDPLLPLEESLLKPATSTWGVFTLTRYFHLRSVYSDPLLPSEEFLSL